MFWFISVVVRLISITHWSLYFTTTSLEWMLSYTYLLTYSVDQGSHWLPCVVTGLSLSTALELWEGVTMIYRPVISFTSGMFT